MQRVGLLNGNNVTYDHDLSAGLLQIVQGGIIEGFNVSGSGAGASLLAGKGLIECTRTNGQKVLVYFESTSSVAVDMSGTKKVYITIDQSKLDDGSSNAEDGTGIASISTGASYPAGNYLALYSITGGVVTDARVEVAFRQAIFDNSVLTNLINNIITTGNITANQFIGDGSLITNIVAEVPATQKQYLAGESLASLGLPLYPESPITFAQATTEQVLGYDTNVKRVAFMVNGSGVAGSTIKLPLKKVSSPSAFLGIRIETDNAGSPSGTLAHANATGSVDPATLTTSLVSTTVNFAGAVTLTKGTIYWVVIFPGTYGSETINATNYFAIGTTANPGSPNRIMKSYSTAYNGGIVPTILYTFDGTTFDTATWDQAGSPTQNNALTFAYTLGASMSSRWTYYVRSKATYQGDCKVSGDLGSSISNAVSFQHGCCIQIYWDNNNYIEIANIAGGGGAGGTGLVNIVKGGSNVYTTTFAQSTSVKMEYDYASGKIRFYYLSAGAYVLIGAEQTQYFTGAYKILWTTFYYSGAQSSFSGTFTLDNFKIEGNNKSTYAESTALAYEYVYKTNASNSAKINFVGFNSAIASSGQYVKINTSGVDGNQASLVGGSQYYLANTDGAISTTPGTYGVVVGKALNGASMLINSLYGIVTQPLLTPTVGTSPYTYQNTTGYQAVVSITGGTVSAIQISRDNTNFYTLAVATNATLVLGINDYVKITYTVAPVLKIFTI